LHAPVLVEGPPRISAGSPLTSQQVQVSISQGLARGSMHLDRLARAEQRARCLSGPLVPKGGLKEPRRAQWRMAPPPKPRENQAIRPGDLGSGGRSPGFEYPRARLQPVGLRSQSRSCHREACLPRFMHSSRRPMLDSFVHSSVVRSRATFRGPKPITA
jgi:hypothetical protein